jgi:HK97 family phage major capsid protein/HK97 family phage prohead protease
MTTKTLEITTRSIGQIETRTIDESNRTVEIACSSEALVQRWYGTETLLHTPEAIRLQRFEDGASVLFNHNTDVLIGVIQNVRLDPDKVLRATVRFGKDAQANERFNQVLDGVLRQVSIGYMIHDYTMDKDGNRTITDWEPYEVSFVTVAADPTVGEGRELFTTPILPPETPDTTGETRKMTPETQTLEFKDAELEATRKVELETKRVMAINSIAKQHDMRDLGDVAITEKATVEDFQRSVLDELSKRSEFVPNGTPAPAIVKQGFRTLGENLQAIQRATLGIARDERLITSTEGGNGGYLIDATLINDSLATAFSESPILSRCFSVPIDNMDKRTHRVDFVRPKDKGGKVFFDAQWLEEGDTISNGAGDVEKVRVEAYKLGTSVPVTEEMLASAMMLEAFVRPLSLNAIVQKAEQAVLNGNGVNKPFGIFKAGAMQTINKEDGQAAKTLNLMNLAKMYAGVDQKKNAVWLHSRSVIQQIFTLNTGGQNLFIPPGMVSQSPEGSILGIPLIQCDYTSALGTVNDIVLANLSNYLFLNASQVAESSSMEVEFLKDLKVFKFRTYAGGQPLSKGTTTYANGDVVSPYVNLQTRS